MNYNVFYYCCTHIGKIRRINQDNYICAGKYCANGGKTVQYSVQGVLHSDSPSIVGVFDGMGGEERGEMASMIAAKCASEVFIGNDPQKDLSEFCSTANAQICKFAIDNDISSMGTTAAVLAFARREIVLCNIGDSKVFRFCEGELKQISTDHYSVAVFGQKPALSQYLGAPPDEMNIEPYITAEDYRDGDIYLICSDGLTDMVSAAEIRKILMETQGEETAISLLNAALENGGRDNITIILCRIESY